MTTTQRKKATTVRTFRAPPRRVSHDDHAEEGTEGTSQAVPRVVRGEREARREARQRVPRGAADRADVRVEVQGEVEVFEVQARVAGGGVHRTRSVKPRGCPKCAHNAPASKTHNFLAWCEKNGERGKKLSREYVDKDKPPTAVPKASHYKAKWKCSNVECKHVWRAEMCDRTRSDKPRGCPQCANHAPASKTNNFLTWCEKKGERGKKLLKEYVDPDKPPTAVTYGSKYKALWKCAECDHEWLATLKQRTKTSYPNVCPACKAR